ncbi:MAG: alpha-galactosidase [Acidobacteria bacterium]|nr:alpha-galactosidase [Acidobacteriota bacterium]
MRLRAIAVSLALAAGLVPAGASATQEITDQDAYGRITSSEVVLGNSAVERRWRAGALVTTLLRDKRTDLLLAPDHSDFSLILGGERLPSGALVLTGVRVEAVGGGGVRARFSLLAPGVAGIERTVEVYPGIAGFRSATRIDSLVPVALSGYTLDEVAAGPDPAATIQAFRAGSDWRSGDGWDPVSLGDPHKGDWRASASADAGAALEGPGEWLSLAWPGDRSLFMVSERRDYASSRMSYDGSVARAVVDLSRDVIYLGPLESDGHAENPGAGPARVRALLPGKPVALEPVFTGFGTDGDDEPWQHFRALERGLTYPRAVTFNTNGVDDNRISTGAKDDVDFARFQSLLAAAREMGVETFVFDDGWQATSGDWCADSAACPEPRAPRFPPRFPDPDFSAVREALRGDPDDPSDDVALGLWMTPMEFNPASAAFRANPQWTCAPVGGAAALLSAAQPDDGSNEAGMGVWNPEALGVDPDSGAPARLIDYVEGRIRRAIEVYGATYFKFDFLVWLDCAGAEPVDLYGYHDSFLAMIDRLRAAHPEVTFQIDETNDYRLFPFESVARGPSWFQNGTPGSEQLLHNLWDLAPYVPGFSIGQHALSGAGDLAARGVDYLMAVALGSHVTFWTDIDTAFSPDQRAQVKRWTDFYKANRERLATFAYPLLADPTERGWTALQPWNPETGRGFLLAYRQAASNATQTIPLRGMAEGRSFRLTARDPANVSASDLGLYSSAELRKGIEVTVGAQYGYAIIEIAPEA